MHGLLLTPAAEIPPVSTSELTNKHFLSCTKTTQYRVMTGSFLEVFPGFYTYLQITKTRYQCPKVTIRGVKEGLCYL